ncbi:MAG: glycosyltransferase family 4 protein [Candidatus Promineifilaceae bacterium]
MRIGIDLRLPHYQMGGISQYALHLLPALAALDADNAYTVLQMRKDAVLRVPDVDNFRRANLLTPCHHRLERWALSAELIPHHLDVFHSPDFIPPQWGGRRQIITVHDLNFLYYPQYLTAESRAYYNDQIRWAVTRADAISADSHHTRQDLIEQLDVPPEKVTTVHLAANPIYELAYDSAEIGRTLAKHNLPNDFLLFVGTIEPRKNVPTLLRAYYDLRHDAGFDLPLVLVGRRGWLSDDVFELIDQLQLQESVRHLTGVFDEQLAHLYHAASMLILPSHYEGFGLPPLEAMHCGCPVVTSDRGSLPEIVGDAGFLLDADDIPQWVDTLYHVLHDSDAREKMIARGYQQAQTFSWDNAARQTLNLYSNR